MKRLFLAPRQSGKTYAAIHDFVDRTMKGERCFFITFNTDMIRHIKYQITEYYFGLTHSSNFSKLSMLSRFIVTPRNLVNRIRGWSIDKIIFDECIPKPYSMEYDEIRIRRADC